MMDIRKFEHRDEDGVVELWTRCGLVFPWNDPRKDISRKLLVDPDLFLVGLMRGKIVATVMAGYEGRRGWLNYMAVDPIYERQGLGRTIVEHAELLLRERGCPKVNLQVRLSNLEAVSFYRAIGYDEDPVISMSKWLEQDQKSGAGD